MSPLRIVGVVQARTGSSRLPAKVLADILGQTMLARVMARVLQSTRTQEVVVATTTEPEDDTIETICRDRRWPCFRGSANDVLDRFHRAAEAHDAEVIVRVTADCPLLDPEIIDLMIDAFECQAVDYASGDPQRSFPRGLDVEVLSRQALVRAWQNAAEPFHRAHVTSYIYRNPHVFRLAKVASDQDYSSHRWTVDTPEDMEFVREVFRRLPNRDRFSWRDVLAIVNREPRLMAINRHVRQKDLEEG